MHDNGNTGTGGDLVSVATSTINITAVNDAPVATITPVSYATTEQTSLTLKGTGLSISDVDAGSGSMTRDAGGHRGHADGDRRHQRRGGDQLRHLLRHDHGHGGAGQRAAEHATPPARSATSTAPIRRARRSTLTLTVHDNGNTGTGGDLVSVATSTINITAVNDAPVATITPVSYANTEQMALTLKNNGPVDLATWMPAPAR